MRWQNNSNNNGGHNDGNNNDKDFCPWNDSFSY